MNAAVSEIDRLRAIAANPIEQPWDYIGRLRRRDAVEAAAEALNRNPGFAMCWQFRARPDGEMWVLERREK